MFTSQMHIPLASMITLSVVLLLAGIALTLPLYHFNWRLFVHSKLFVKIVFWVPILCVFTVYLYVGNLGRLFILILLIMAALSELLRVEQNTKARNILPIVFYVLFSIALLHLYLLGTTRASRGVAWLITICYSSVLSDVTAFFMGSYIGRHKLPPALNNLKSWEGVIGQVVGSFVGVSLVNTFLIHVTNFWLFLPIGVGAACGDLANSYVKRRLDIKDWGNSIPGHGGFLDRLSSLAGSAALTFYCLLVAHLL